MCEAKSKQPVMSFVDRLAANIAMHIRASIKRELRKVARKVVILPLSLLDMAPPRRGEGTSRLVYGWCLLVFLGIAVGVPLFRMSLWMVSGAEDGTAEVASWMKKKGCPELTDAVIAAGVKNLSQLARLDVTKEDTLKMLDNDDMGHLVHAVISLREQYVLRKRLIENKLDHYYFRLLKRDISSLSDLSLASDGVLHLAWEESLKDYLRFKLLISGAHHDDPDEWKMAVLMEPKPKVSLKSSILGGMIGLAIFLLSLKSLVLFVNMNYASHPHAAQKQSVFELVTGNYLAPQYCKVFWEWDEPQSVGKTMAFKIKFYQRNGRPYPISNGDNLLVEIMHGTNKVALTAQHGGPDAGDMNSTKVAFTVHKSGEYKISVMVGARHIRGSPFIKKFKPGNVDPGKTGFVNHSSILVCTKNVLHSLVLEPRDEYGNLSTYSPENDSTKNYQIKITECGGTESFCVPLQIFYEKLSKQVNIQLKVNKEGCYQAEATYNKEKLRNGEFNIVVLSESDSSLVKKNIAKKSHNVWYEARLLSCNYDKQPKAKKVYCYISPKQLTVKEFYLKIFPKRLFTFRVCPSTKFFFHGYNNQYEAPVLTVEDGAQPPVDLATKDRDIIAATYANFLLKNIGGSETFQDKQDFFYHEVRQLHKRRYHDTLTVKINRSNLLESSFKATKHFSTSDWCKSFEIIFQGEEGLDWGGLRREWFEIICTELFDPQKSGLFMRFKDDNQGLVHPNPNRPSHLQSKLKYYEFAGKIIGKCLYESALGGCYRQLVKARFTRSFLGQLIGLRVYYKYLEQDDPDLYMMKVKYIQENSVEDMDLFFVEEEYNSTGQLLRTVELLPNGSRVLVNENNKLKYLDLLAQYKLANCVKEEIEHFLRGLNELIPDNLLSIFDENELELLMCGTGNFSISDFKDHHIVCVSTAEFRRTLDWFWTIVASFTQEHMARLLQFTTGCSQLPPGGFAELNPKFQITTAPTHGNLPTAHTCFNQLCLPQYDSVEEFHQALLIAINEGNEGFGMI